MQFQGGNRQADSSEGQLLHVGQLDEADFVLGREQLFHLVFGLGAEFDICALRAQTRDEALGQQPGGRGATET